MCFSLEHCSLILALWCPVIYLEESPFNAYTEKLSMMRISFYYSTLVQLVLVILRVEISCWADG